VSFSPLPAEFSRCLNVLQSRRNPRIVDLGSGNGDFAQALKQFGLQVWGVDRLPAAAGVTANLRGDALNPPFLAESLDCILAGNLVRHLLVQDKPGSFLKVWLKLLRPGGSIFLFEDEPNRADPAEENFVDLQGFLAQLMPATRGPLFSRHQFLAKTGVWTPGFNWVTGIEKNNSQPDIAAVCQMIGVGISGKNPKGTAGQLLSRIEENGLSYGTFWWAHTQLA